MVFVACTLAVLCAGCSPQTGRRLRVDLACLDGRYKSTWQALPSFLREPTYEEYCSDLARWADHVYQFNHDPQVPAEVRARETRLLRQRLGFDL